MKKLQTELRNIDHKGYPAYKALKGRYRFDAYELYIDHVQGDPFASPSSLSVRIKGAVAGFPKEFYEKKYRKTALEDFLLRGFATELDKISFKTKGSGKSGLVAASHPGQEILERSACQVLAETGDVIFRFAVGFPANGRTVLAGELEKILFKLLPPVVEHCGIWNNLNQKKLTEQIFLADDREAIKEQLKEKNLIAFVANGSVLPRESGVSQRPMKDAVPFQSPESMEVELKLPHKGTCKGMGIPEGITLIVGGGYHGKSTLLQTLERAVYPHIAGDGREYAVTEETGMKIRAEDGRSVCRKDISLFIQNLPNGKDTVCFSTLDASGSTSQAANTVEAIEAGSRLLLIDEDTSATNFMIRDELMEKVISAGEEPIVPFIKRVSALYQEKGVSTILVAGSCGAFFHVADHVIQMERYLPKEITEQAKQTAKEYPLELSSDGRKIEFAENGQASLPKLQDRTKIKIMGTDGFLLGKAQVDLRYLEQITDGEQMMAIAKILEYLLQSFGGRETSLNAAVEEVLAKLKKTGFEILGRGNVIANMAMPRKMEIMGCLNRFLKK